MGKSKPYNGHHCWNCWNVALWIGNDEPLYRIAIAAKRSRPNLTQATAAMLDCLPPATPDGAKYTKHAVRSALAGLE